MKSNHNLCPSCGRALKGTRRKFCSTECVLKSSNSKHQNYKNQHRRGVSKKMQLMKMKGMSCKVCGYKKNYAAMAFHHRDPKKKSHGLDSRACSNMSWKSLVLEAEKCDLVCMNCHMEIHHPQFEAENANKIMDDFVQFNQTEVNQHLLKPMNCERCGVEYQPDKHKRKFCSDKCYRLNSRRVERPSKEQLEKDLSEMNFVKVGKKYGVSDNAVRKWLKSY